MFEIDTNNLPFVRTRQALLVLDLQNEFISPEGQLPVDQPPHFVEDILKLVPVFRGAGNVIWIRSEFKVSRPVNGDGEDSEEVVADTDSIMGGNQADAMRKSRKAMAEAMKGRRGTNEGSSIRAAEFSKVTIEADSDRATSTEETFLTVAAGEKPRFVLPQSHGANPPAKVLNCYDSTKDIVFKKSYYSAFKDGTLIKFLRSKFVTEIYICGALSNMSVYATAVDAAQFGLAITLIDDCLGYRSKERHEEVLKRLLKSTGCDNINCMELIEDLEHRAKIIQKTLAPAPRPVRRAPPTQRERKVKEPELDSMMSKLNLTPDGSSIPAGSSSSKRPVPAAPMNSAPSVVADLESGESAESIEDEESQEFRRLTLPPRKAPPQGAVKQERVQSKVRTRKRPTKQSSGDSPSASNDSILRTPEEQTTPEGTPSPPRIKKVEQVGKKMAEESASEATGQPKTVVPPRKPSVTKSNGTKKVQPDLEDSLKLLSLKTVSSTSEVGKPAPGAEDEPAAICEGDTILIHNLLKGGLAEGIFEKIRDEVRWQKMSHQGGDVPRLVAVQGKIGDDGSIPIYRHPSDESPPLLPFSPTVSLIREQAEKELGHPLNHVLIQFYRDGTDYISEHSDKTLDIVPKTFIVNVSLGAQRTMIFRTKKKQNEDGTKALSTGPSAPRKTTRAPMPHNSMCKVGLVTNMRWLHGIRQDKRLPSEKSNAELAYGTARISLTFRQIGTFLSYDQQKIWGQGAVAKTQDKANFVINGNTPEAESMIRAFGQENHSSEFNWAGHYGGGFDVLHLNNTPKLFLSGSSIADSRVKLALAEYGIKWDEGKLSSSFKWTDGALKANADELPNNFPVKFVDNDLSKSTITGDIAILLYLDAVYGPKDRSPYDTAKLYTRLQQAATLQALVDTSKADVKSLELGLELWDTFAREGPFMAGKEASIVDWMLLPILGGTIDGRDDDDGLEDLNAYYLRMRGMDNVITALGPLTSKEPARNKGKEVEAKQEAGGRGPTDDYDDDDEDDDEDDDSDEDDGDDNE